MGDDLVTRLDALYAEEIWPTEKWAENAQAFVTAWPELRDRLTAAEAERDALHTKLLELQVRRLDRAEAAEAERDELRSLLAAHTGRDLDD